MSDCDAIAELEGSSRYVIKNVEVRID
jgi:hypothetical protein